MAAVTVVTTARACRATAAIRSPVGNLVYCAKPIHRLRRWFLWLSVRALTRWPCISTRFEE
jgi:hypothetical protein